ncbi:MAG: cytochrome c oxidase subunit II [Thermoanaerobaculia bacterium]
MFPNSPMFPEASSALARDVDRLFFFSLAGSVFFSALIFILVVGFAVKFRRRHPDEIGVPDKHSSLTLEILWSVIPLALMMVLFVWGTKVFFAISRPPSNAAQYFVIGRQWMWKIQHPEGNREINELHIPLGRPIKLTMTSEDVIHSFFIPAFRVKADVVPGRYQTLWFQADRTGTFYLFCSQYCGAEHSRMVGRVVVMEAHDYEAWLAGSGPGSPASLSGDALFTTFACNTCHRPDTAARAPLLAGLHGSHVLLQGGQTVLADDSYIRESILDPAAKVTAGFQPIMPSFKNQLNEDQILQLINYIKALKGAEPHEPAAPLEAAAPRSSSKPKGL